MRRALAGLAGVSAVDMDVGHDLFRVHGTAAREDVFAAVRALGYAPHAADASGFRASVAVHPTGVVPQVVREALDRACESGKRFVLVDCGGDS